MAAPVVAAVGLSALMRDLKKASDPRAGAVVDEMKQAGRSAAQPIADAARAAVPHDSGRVSGGTPLEDDIRVSATRTGAAIRVGRKGPLSRAGWIEFGGTRRKPHTSYRDYVQGGRFLFPAAKGRAGETADLYSKAVNDAFAHFNWTNSGDNPGGVHD